MLADAVEFVKIIKKAAIEAVDSTKPVNIYFGSVESTSPLRINVEQKITLTKLQLILTERVTEEPLKAGDELILLRQQGGQKYVVLDRIGVVS